MNNILLVQASPRGERSVSRILAGELVRRLRAPHPHSRVIERDLAAQPLPHLDPVCLAAFMNAPERHSPDERRAVATSDAVVAEVLACDVLVIATPMWNFSVPSVLKAWIDHLARSGKTFRYTPDGVVGLVHGKRAYLAVAAGSLYSTARGQANDFVTPYLRAVLGFLGIQDVHAALADGTAMRAHQESAVARALAMVEIG